MVGIPLKLQFNGGENDDKTPNFGAMDFRDNAEIRTQKKSHAGVNVARSARSFMHEVLYFRTTYSVFRPTKS